MADNVGQSDLKRLCRRFEIAVGNFGRSCISMRANEKAFQAWYAACVIQEFGLSRVYREVHLDKRELFQLAPAHRFTRCVRRGNELFPDLSVSWQPDVDARHSGTRSRPVKHASQMLPQMAILSELKVTGSTSTPTPPEWIRRDLAKLAVFAAAHKRAAARNKAASREIACYMVILDNRCDKNRRACPHYDKDRIGVLLAEVARDWPPGTNAPTVLLICPCGESAVIRAYRDFGATNGTHIKHPISCNSACEGVSAGTGLECRDCSFASS